MQAGGGRCGGLFKNPHKTTLTQVAGLMEPLKALELECKVNRPLAAEDEEMERTSCPQVLLPFPSLSTWATWGRQNHRA